MNLTNEAKILVGIGIATVVLLLGAVFLLSKNTPVSPNAESNKPVDQSLLIRDDSHKSATGSAKVNLIEFSDFQCPACKAAFPTVERIREDYKANPQFNFVYRHFPLPQHQYGEIAAQASEAANEQGKFWQMYEKLFKNQDEWSGGKPEELFVKYAQELGLDTNKFKADLDSKKFASRVKKDLNDGLGLGVNSTPTFYINGKKNIGGLSYDEMKSQIESELKK